MVVTIDQPDAETAAAETEVRSGNPVGGDTPEGASSKGKGSRWNSLKHGLMAKDLLPEDLAEEVKKLRAILTDHFKPQNPYEFEQILIMGRAGAQLERLRQLRLVDMQRAMDRAELCWDSDRCVYSDALASRISRDPFRISRALARSKQGAEWLLRNLVDLRGILDSHGGWDEGQRRLAQDVLGIRHELRSPGGKISTETDARTLAAVVDHEIDRLQRLLENSLLALDGGAQAIAMVGMPGEEDPDSKKHRKYEASARREYEQAKADLLASQARVAAGDNSPAPAPPPVTSPYDMGPDPDFDPEPDPEPEPEPAPQPAPSELQMLRSKLDTVLPEPESAPEERSADATSFRLVEVAPAVEPVSLAELAAVLPQTACVASSASRAAVAPKPRPDRRVRRAQEKLAREAARRKARPLL
jgi:hypothetical protein